MKIINTWANPTPRLATGSKAPDLASAKRDEPSGDYFTVTTEKGDVTLRRTARSEFEMDVFVEDREGNLIRGYSDNHGSHVAATISGGGETDIVIAPGVAVAAELSPTEESIASAIRYSETTGASLVSNSWGMSGSGEFSSLLHAWSEGKPPELAAGHWSLSGTELPYLIAD